MTGDPTGTLVKHCAPDNPAMHLLIPYASALSERGTSALRKLQLPYLTRLLTRLTPTERVGQDEFTLTPPNERALAQQFGWQGDDGCLPFAAHQAALDGIAIGDQAWGLLTPVHWHVGTDQVSLIDPALLYLSAQESHAMFEAVRPLFEGEGWTLAWGAPGRWYAGHESLDQLACASIDRVIGRNIDLWLPSTSQARLVRRLQNEVQMLLYQQPINDARAEQGSLPVNSFWLSGCGRAQPVQPAADSAGELLMPTTLGPPMLASDWANWSEAWRALDAGPVKQAFEAARRGEPVVVTLCGERFAQRYEAVPQSLWARVRQRFVATSVAPLLEAL